MLGERNQFLVRLDNVLSSTAINPFGMAREDSGYIVFTTLSSENSWEITARRIKIIELLDELGLLFLVRWSGEENPEKELGYAKSALKLCRNC